ncbi:TlpA family protein disulfide reductase [bacterium]|nr:MAG: TlpA family protein disulfide reductase [bacterium]
MRSILKGTRCAVMALGLWILLTPSYAQKKSITIGQKAPDIKVKAWLKGDPVSGFEPGKVYVVEFWATWCKPCINLMPQLSKLAQKYAGKVEVIGINILDKSPQTKIAEFVKDMGNKMEYVVGLDDGYMNENWFMASGSSGIPTSFIVDQRGNIAWYGNGEIESNLAMVLKGEPVAELNGKKEPSDKVRMQNFFKIFFLVITIIVLVLMRLILFSRFLLLFKGIQNLFLSLNMMIVQRSITFNLLILDNRILLQMFITTKTTDGIMICL